MIFYGFRLGIKERKKEVTKIMSKVNHSEIDLSKLSIEKVMTKDVPGGGDKGKYSFAKVKYRYPDTPKPYAFVVKAPQGTANNGIHMKKEDNGSISYSIRYEPDDPTEAEALIGNIDLLKQWAAQVFCDNRIEMQHLDPLDDKAFILRRMTKILRVQTDPLTGVRIPKSKPFQYLKLSTGWNNPIFRTKFQRVIGEDEDGEPIMEDVPWEYLTGMRVTFIPQIQFYRLCSSSQGQSFQCDLKRAIVVDIQKPNRENPHMEEAKKLLSDPNYLSGMEESIRIAKEMAAERMTDPEFMQLQSGGGVGTPESGAPPVDPLEAVRRVTPMTTTDSPTPTSMGATDPTTPSPPPATPTLESFVAVNPLSSSTAGLNLPALPGMPGVPTFPT
uniref:Uncharacterized protein n=1 Tax=Pithovirus LCPAC304 TaxID=2506594 RepID=A0A481Z9Z5_9VIRU|nr:MAG: hypothetical protein LCPAC304_02600 [Pithovirus LCPAC304]